MKPEEAENKWCPMTFNRDDHDECYPHQCMAWVWDTLPSANGKSVKHPGDGHCGLVKK